MNINLKNPLNDGLIETLSSEHPSACKCLGQWEGKWELEKNRVVGYYCKKSMNFRMNNGNTNNGQWQC